MPGLLGQNDEWLAQIEARFPETDILVRGNEIVVSGDRADTVGRLFEEMITLLQRGLRIDGPSLGLSMDMVTKDENPSEVLSSEILKSARGSKVRPKSAGQKRYVDAIEKNIITFGIGPAGTGKSWLAVAMAVQALQAKQVERIILTRRRGRRAARVSSR
jgi:phosphate starvation-inducible PhoH-like protein